MGMISRCIFLSAFFAISSADYFRGHSNGGSRNGGNGGSGVNGGSSYDVPNNGNGKGVSSSNGRFNGGDEAYTSYTGGLNEASNGFVDPIAALAEAIPGGGVPGDDYPILVFVPDTGFTCTGLIPGYYVDTNLEASCQVFHICQEDGRMDSFLCPNGTLFNQQYFVCDWWFNVDCSTAAQFYGLNAELGKVPENGAKNGVGGNGGSSGSGGFGGNGGLGGTDNGVSGGFENFGTGGHTSEPISSSYGVPLPSGNGLSEGGNGGHEGLNGNGRLIPSAPITSYGAPSKGNNNGNGAGRRKANGQRNGKRNGNGRNGIQTPSGFYQTPGR